MEVAGMEVVYPACSGCPGHPGEVIFHSHLTGVDKVGQLLRRLEQHLEAPEDITVLFVKAETKLEETEEQKAEGKYDFLKVELDSDAEDNGEEDNVSDCDNNDCEDFSDHEAKNEDLEYTPEPKRSTAKNPNPNNQHPCDQCDYLAASGKALLRHTKRQHPGKTFICNKCQEVFETELKLYRHLMKHHEVDKLDCDHCDYQTIKPNALQKHKIIKHKDLGYNKIEGRTCEHCGKAFGNQSSLWGHIQRMHLDNAEYKKKAAAGQAKKDRTCPVCSETFCVTGSAMTMHKQKCQFEKTGELKYVCEMCGRAFGTVHQRCSHRSQCLGKGKVKNKKCPYDDCEYITRTKAELNNHVRQYHLKLPIEKNHICNHCGKAYNLLYQLKLHIKSIHLDIKPHVCQECGKAFSRKDKLQDHIDLHKGLFKYKCPFCQKGLNNSGALCNHKRICPANPERFASLNDARIARESGIVVDKRISKFSSM
jgi:KRAB domain-containing zinc finger protein